MRIFSSVMTCLWRDAGMDSMNTKARNFWMYVNTMGSYRLRIFCRRQSFRSVQRLSNSALEITLKLDSAIAAPATTGLKNPNAARGMPATL